MKKTDKKSGNLCLAVIFLLLLSITSFALVLAQESGSLITPPQPTTSESKDTNTKNILMILFAVSSIQGGKWQTLAALAPLMAGDADTENILMSLGLMFLLNKGGSKPTAAQIKTSAQQKGLVPPEAKPGETPTETGQQAPAPPATCLGEIRKIIYGDKYLDIFNEATAQINQDALAKITGQDKDDITKIVTSVEGEKGVTKLTIELLKYPEKKKDLEKVLWGEKCFNSKVDASGDTGAYEIYFNNGATEKLKYLFSADDKLDIPEALLKNKVADANNPKIFTYNKLADSSFVEFKYLNEKISIQNAKLTADTDILLDLPQGNSKINLMNSATLTYNFEIKEITKDSKKEKVYLETYQLKGAADNFILNNSWKGWEKSIEISRLDISDEKSNLFKDNLKDSAKSTTISLGEKGKGKVAIVKEKTALNTFDSNFLIGCEGIKYSDASYTMNLDEKGNALDAELESEAQYSGADGVPIKFWKIDISKTPKINEKLKIQFVSLTLFSNLQLGNYDFILNKAESGIIIGGQGKDSKLLGFNYYCGKKEQQAIWILGKGYKGVTKSADFYAVSYSKLNIEKNLAKAENIIGNVVRWDGYIVSSRKNPEKIVFGSKPAGSVISNAIKNAGQTTAAAGLAKGGSSTSASTPQTFTPSKAAPGQKPGTTSVAPAGKGKETVLEKITGKKTTPTSKSSVPSINAPEEKYIRAGPEFPSHLFTVGSYSIRITSVDGTSLAYVRIIKDGHTLDCHTGFGNEMEVEVKSGNKCVPHYSGNEKCRNVEFKECSIINGVFATSISAI